MRPTASTSTSAVQGGDEVGQVVVGGAQVDRAFERFVEQRREGPGLAVDRAGRAVRRRRTARGCRRADVGLVEEGGAAAGARPGLLEVGVAGPWRVEDARSAGWAPRLVPPFELQVEAGA